MREAAVLVQRDLLDLVGDVCVHHRPPRLPAPVRKLKPVVRSSPQNASGLRSRRRIRSEMKALDLEMATLIPGL
nr:unnamed protein product [Digitaria exilis]